MVSGLKGMVLGLETVGSDAVGGAWGQLVLGSEGMGQMVSVGGRGVRGHGSDGIGLEGVGSDDFGVGGRGVKGYRVGGHGVRGY